MGVLVHETNFLGNDQDNKEWGFLSRFQVESAHCNRPVLIDSLNYLSKKMDSKTFKRVKRQFGDHLDNVPVDRLRGFAEQGGTMPAKSGMRRLLRRRF